MIFLSDMPWAKEESIRFGVDLHSDLGFFSLPLDLRGNTCKVNNTLTDKVTLVTLQHDLDLSQSNTYVTAACE